MGIGDLMTVCINRKNEPAPPIKGIRGGSPLRCFRGRDVAIRIVGQLGDLSVGVGRRLPVALAVIGIEGVIAQRVLRLEKVAICVVVSIFR